MCLLWGTTWVLISQKTEFFIVTAVKTSNRTFLPFTCFESPLRTVAVNLQLDPVASVLRSVPRQQSLRRNGSVRFIQSGHIRNTAYPWRRTTWTITESRQVLLEETRGKKRTMRSRLHSILQKSRRIAKEGILCLIMPFYLQSVPVSTFSKLCNL
jgi:hypothetical protein